MVLAATSQNCGCHNVQFGPQKPISQVFCPSSLTQKARVPYLNSLFNSTIPFQWYYNLLLCRLLVHTTLSPKPLAGRGRSSILDISILQEKVSVEAFVFACLCNAKCLSVATYSHFEVILINWNIYQFKPQLSNYYIRQIFHIFLCCLAFSIVHFKTIIINTKTVNKKEVNQYISYIPFYRNRSVILVMMEPRFQFVRSGARGLESSIFSLLV